MCISIHVDVHSIVCHSVHPLPPPPTITTTGMHYTLVVMSMLTSVDTMSIQTKHHCFLLFSNSFAKRNRKSLAQTVEREKEKKKREREREERKINRETEHRERRNIYSYKYIFTWTYGAAFSFKKCYKQIKKPGLTIE